MVDFQFVFGEFLVWHAQNKTLLRKSLVWLAYGMPAPVRQVVTSRWIAMLIVIVVPILVVTGVLSISWNGYQPSFNIDQKRAVQVERDVEQAGDSSSSGFEKAWKNSRRR